MDYSLAYQKAIEDPSSYWDYFANKLKWREKWSNTLLGRKWFVNGRANIAENSLSHEGKALIWFGEGGAKREITYAELRGIVDSIASTLKSKGVKEGDRVAIYMPNIPEAIASILACAKIGSVYTLLFAGLGEEAISSRLADLNPKIIISTEKSSMRGKEIKLFDLGGINLPRGLEPSDLNLPYYYPESNEPLKIMYTSGTTGRPKGIVLPHGSWMVGDYNVFDIMFSLREGDVVFTTADVGWITFSRIMYGTLIHGGTLAFMEGAPDFPRDRIPRIVDDVNPKVFFTSPTLIRLLAKLDVKPRRIEYVATAGEIMNEEAWKFAESFADNVTDVYGQTEAGYIVGTPFALGVEPKKGFAGVPFPGVVLETVDEQGKPSSPGILLVKTPFPTQFLGVNNNPRKYEEYFSLGGHNTGDIAIIEHNYVKIVGRSDDMIKVAGHRLTSGEIEALISSIPGVVEVAAIGIPDEVKGEKIVIFYVGDPAVDIKGEVRKKLGQIYVIDKVYNVERLPKSRSGKIVRRALKDLMSGREIDKTILEDPEVLSEIKAKITSS
ncbi:AMP-binding protein [Acidianus sp. RZ1]|uniref:AMP-binding protein n=1 Tax=Acidianus sp. RZ1 TaxID=1540082 RepID=UPI001490EE0E|nr:AMP-binding protein [Acidianus sp. RZ1]NON62635.1 AMP-binding protein [Acidianus sp. RZ1]